MNTGSGTQAPLTSTQWLICLIAVIGFAFDIYELLMLPLIVGPALQELLGAAPGSELFNSWVGKLFYIPAIAGGIFGLLGGYLTDRLGRRRVLTWSILIYAFAAFAAGFATNIYWLLICRCFVFVGVCVEFVAAVAWLAELFPEPVRREKVLGMTQAFSSVGGLMVAAANGLCVKYAADLPAVQLPEFVSSFGAVKESHAAWRYTLMSGILPAIPLILIRPFLPESPAWAAKKAAGTLKRPSLRALFSPALARTTVVTTLMFALAYGAAFGAIQHVPRMIPGLAEVKAQAKAAGEKAAEGKPQDQQKRLAAMASRKVEQALASEVTTIQEIGGLAGRCLLAGLALAIVSRRVLLRCFQIPGLIVMPVVFYYCATTSLDALKVGIFLAGLLTVGQFSFWGNYLPRAYPVHLRGTGESFAANIGGRLIGTSFAWLTTTLATTPDLSQAPTKLAQTAALIGFAVYLGGFLLSFALPEPPAEDHE
ncbi:MAG: MFS transporter [Verrucomicrobia bacterium]|nr:MFS transporter [Verrucomicrobiota bacterium]